MKGFGSRSRRAAGARPTKAARPVVTTRSPDAALGRETRRLAGASGRGPSTSSRRGGTVARSAVARMRRPGRIVTQVRAAGLLGMLAAGFLFTLVTGRTAFCLSRTDLPPLRWTDPAVVQAALALTSGTNVFRIDTRPLEGALLALPTVASAQVSVGLPDASVIVRIEERQPVLAWQVGGTRYLADAGGLIFTRVDATAKLPTGVAVIDDRRTHAEAALAIGGHLDAVDADVATRLGSLTPTDVGSTAQGLRITVTDTDGFIVSASTGWSAVFGFYSPATRSTDMIPGQVRLLRSLLTGREGSATLIILASETDGTYIPKPTGH
ncbi:MAG TPA: FtsQ-type POTRA domain-containing protein [Candidatus Dormibacteraeota bacterium]|nr:FtsQ-type POTRA domain-containing protein [Candidatus Dormibacteraeota bacterium]